MKRFKLNASGLERQLAQTQTLQKVIADISAELDPSRILDEIIDQLGEVFEADRVAIFLRQQDSGRLTAVAYKGLSAAYVAAVDAKRSSAPDWALDFRNPIFIPDATDSSFNSALSEEVRREGFRSMLILPLIFANDILGVLALYHDETRTYDEDEISLAFTFAHQVAIAIRNAASFKKEREQAELLAQKNRQLAALLRTSNFLIEGNDLREQLRLIASTVKEGSGFQVIKIFVLDEESEAMEMASAVGLDREGKRPENNTLSVREVVERWFLEEKRISNSYLVHQSHAATGLTGGSESAGHSRRASIGKQDHWHTDDVLIIPLYIRGKRLVGMIWVDHPLDGKMPSLESIQSLEIFAGQTAIAIRNSRLFSRLRSALRAKDEFLSIASHELKTPLTSIMAYTQHLLQKLPATEDNSSTRSHLEVVNAQSRRMARLVQELLDVSALEKGNFELRKTVIDLGEVIARSVGVAKATSTKHRFVIERPSAPVKLVADGHRIGQVVDGLVANAMKYSPEGGDIRVLLHAEPDEAIVSIGDEGVGIAKEHLPHIFERFYQANGNPRSRLFGGMGLGLYICKQLIEAHDGRIWVQSRKGEGSTFYFSLPLHSDESKA